MNLDTHDRTGRKVIVRIPEDTFALTSSFVLELLGPSIRKLGAKKFLEQYEFEGWDARATIEAAIEDVLDL
ncbi:MAG: hypothetical protein F4X47_03215 [Gammaproteobacteria bacterium]|nr:hypothetical protein [Gammaproteobacteria bacterium]